MNKWIARAKAEILNHIGHATPAPGVGFPTPVTGVPHPANSVKNETAATSNDCNGSSLTAGFEENRPVQADPMADGETQKQATLAFQGSQFAERDAALGRDDVSHCGVHNDRALVDQACPNSTVTAEGASRDWSSTPSGNLAPIRSLDQLAAPSISVTLRRTSISGRGSLYQVALDGEVIVSSSRDPEYDACRELIRRGLRGVAVFSRPGTTPHFKVDVERGARLITKESAEGVRIVIFSPGEAIARQAHPALAEGDAA